jgi:hypothetical protein
LLAGLLVATTIAVGCDDRANISGLPGYAISDVRVTPSIDTIYIPDTVRVTDRVQFFAAVEGKDGLLHVAPMVWSVSDPSIASIDAQGVVTPRGIGTVEIRAEADKIGRATLVILPLPLPALVVTPGVDTIFVEEPIVPARDTARFVAQALDTLGQPVAGVTYVWGVSPSTVATVDQEGLVRGTRHRDAYRRGAGPGDAVHGGGAAGHCEHRAGRAPQCGPRARHRAARRDGAGLQRRGGGAPVQLDVV